MCQVADFVVWSRSSLLKCAVLLAVTSIRGESWNN
jgi:hypothetical protein